MLAKTILLGTLFLSTSYSLLAQSATTSSGNSVISPSTTQDLNQYLREYYGQRKGGVTEREFEGQTYLHDEWKTYVVSVTFEKNPLELHQARYDTYTDEIVLLLDGEQRYLRSEFVKEFRIESEENQEVRQFINPRYQEFSPKEGLPLLEVLTTGTISLFREVKANVVTSSGRYDPSTGGAENADRVVKNVMYYLEREGYLYPVENKLRFSRLLDALGNEDFDERRYARENGLRLSRPQDWPKIVAASNES